MNRLELEGFASSSVRLRPPNSYLSPYSVPRGLYIDNTCTTTMLSRLPPSGERRGSSQAFDLDPLYNLYYHGRTVRCHWDRSRPIQSLAATRPGPDYSLYNNFIHLFSLPSRSGIACVKLLCSIFTVTSFCSLIIIASSGFAFSVPLRFTFSSYNSSGFVLLINSIMCFIICGWRSSFSTFSLPFPISFIIFFLCSLYLRHSNR